MWTIYQLQNESLEKVALFCKVAFGLCIIIWLYKAVASKWARKILSFIYSQAVPHSFLQSMCSGNKRENGWCQKLLFQYLIDAFMEADYWGGCLESSYKKTPNNNNKKSTVDASWVRKRYFCHQKAMWNVINLSGAEISLKIT